MKILSVVKIDVLILITTCYLLNFTQLILLVHGPISVVTVTFALPNLLVGVAYIILSIHHIVTTIHYLYLYTILTKIILYLLIKLLFIINRLYDYRNHYTYHI